MRILSAAVLAAAAVGCSTGENEPTVENPSIALLSAPAANGELWACKFSVDPVTGQPNGDITTGAISATIVSGDGTLEAGVSGGNTTTIGFNAPGVPQCVKIWSGGTDATVAVTEAPGAGTAYWFHRIVTLYTVFTSDTTLAPTTNPVTFNVEVDNVDAHEIWFKNVKATTPPPPGGCTYTQGYWKTHSHSGPAGPYDDGWQNVGPNEENTLFFNSGATWLQVWNTPPAGNKYYNLAHQYMAAKLNVLNGTSSTAAVTAAIAGAEALFAAQGAGDVTLNNTEKANAGVWAATLDSYNKGLIGPGHCTDEVLPS